MSKVEQDAKMMGKRINMVLMPDHKDPNKLKDPSLAPKGLRPATAGATLGLPPVGTPRPAAPAAAAPAAAPRPAAPAAPTPVGAK